MKRTMLVLLSAMALFGCKKTESPEASKIASLPAITNTSSFASAFTTIFYEGFDSGTAPSTATWTMSGTQDPNSTLCTYNTSVPKIGVVDGLNSAIITATKTGTNAYQSGRIESKMVFTPANNQELKFEAKIKLIARSGSAFKGFAQTDGVWPAFWIVNHDSWPVHGEIDFMEGYSHAGQATSDPKFTSNLFYATTANQPLVGPHSAIHFPSAYTEGWHTYTCYWKKQNNVSSVKYVVDGVTIGTVTDSTYPNLSLNNFNSLRLVLNMVIGDTVSPNEFENNSKIMIFDQAEMWIDYVSVGKLDL